MLVSVASSDVSVAEPPTCAVIETLPIAVPNVLREYIIKLEAVIAELVIVTAPATIAPVVPTDDDAGVAALITNLFPAVDKTKFPLVAVILPSVAVMDVVDAIEPGAVNAAGIVKTTSPRVLVAVIWFAVPVTVLTSPVAPTIFTHEPAVL